MKLNNLMILIPLFCMSISMSSQQGSVEAADHGKQWSIVIHGGAGSDSEKWKKEMKSAREKGMSRALTAGKKMLQDGSPALDVVEAVIKILEDDAAFNAGRGSVLNQEGAAELDASIMNGKNLQCGAVAGVTNVKNPIALARQVMVKTPHVLLVSEGAESFAKDIGMEIVKPDYFLSWHDPRVMESTEISIEEKNDSFHYGTVGCAVLDQHGNLAAGTSTGGTSKKLKGRVGDSPIIGAGTYADNRFAAVSGTGIGEEYIRRAAAYDVIAQMRYASKTLDAAVNEMITRQLPDRSGGLIAVGHDGRIVMQHNTPSMTVGAATSEGRFEIRFNTFSEDRR